MALAQQQIYTIDDIYALPDGQRAELIGGQIYMIPPPNRLHQKLVSELHYQVRDYIKRKGGSCEVYPAPFAVFLNVDEENYVEPDISVICNKHKLTDRGCSGAPDWIIEITSPTNPQMDYGVKLFKYRTAGVREYWIVDPQKNTVMVYDFEKEKESNLYTFDEDINVCIYDDFTINVAKIIP